MNLKEACEELKINYNAMVEKFAGMEAMYMRFLNKFLNDNTYNELEKSWQDSDYNGIEKNAHTLKGVAGNLGLEVLFTISNEIVQKIRNQEYEELDALYQKLTNEYKHTIEVIREIKQ